MAGLELVPHPTLRAPRGPVCLVVMDGVGLGPPDAGNAWHLARTPFLDRMMTGPLVGSLRAHGRAVGMPTDEDMGNSEVGHNALGAGRVFDQGSKLVGRSIASGRLFEGETWRWLLEACRAGGTLHLIGLWSDGNVHSHLDHVDALVDRAIADGAARIRLHALLDGRDVGETTALEYLAPAEAKLAELRAAGHDVRFASGGGRMQTTMDRYEADWRVVERGWRAHVLGDARAFDSASEAVRTFRSEQPGVIDQNLPPFVVRGPDGAPAGPIRDGDAVVFFNFRGDRAIEITRAFETPADQPFPFERERVPEVRFAGMMQYDGDLGLPRRFLVSPPVIERTLGEYLARSGVRQLAVSETQKFGHVTYFFNGNRSGAFDAALERYVQVPSDRVDFWQRPWMKAAEITDATLEHIDAFEPGFVRVNYPNGDMVGHTGVLRSAIIAMEALDLSLERLVRGVLDRGGVLVITADHGNCEQMVERDKKTGALVAGESPEGYKASTSHTLNPVPVAILGAEGLRWDASVPEPGLANLAATCLNLLGFEAPADYERPVLAMPDKETT
ncbi:MAG: 2,3-bisphosphoglycerate-independent phosphoglycerate mutase [Deltaproteobacteria bacterium]|nr:2,3-bisphosphoglycerate-independent phosphoglycerate mutase [Deltaproteobacteria bacterium]